MVYEIPDFPDGSVHFAGSAVARKSPSPAAGIAEPVLVLHRTSLESFIAVRFGEAYGAQVEHYCRHLVGLRAANGAWRAAVGYTGADEGPLFVEHYLDRPVERAMATLMRRPVARAQVVEVGNLAATSPGAAREIIQAMRAHLRRRDFAWVTFTATRELRNTFARLGLDLRVLAPADPRRVPGGRAAWGRYYAHDPLVVFGDLRDARGAVE